MTPSSHNFRSFEAKIRRPLDNGSKNKTADTFQVSGARSRKGGRSSPQALSSERRSFSPPTDIVLCRRSLFYDSHGQRLVAVDLILPCAVNSQEPDRQVRIQSERSSGYRREGENWWKNPECDAHNAKATETPGLGRSDLRYCLERQSHDDRLDCEEPPSLMSAAQCIRYGARKYRHGNFPSSRPGEVKSREINLPIGSRVH